jgi:hypothetical protein
MRNEANIIDLSPLRLGDPVLRLTKDLSNLDTLVEPDFILAPNLTVLEKKISNYDSDLLLADKNLAEVSKKVDDLETVRSVASFDPTSLNLSQLAHTNNWVTTIFWLIIIVILVLIWRCIKRTRWFDSCIKPGLMALWSGIKALLRATFCAVCPRRAENPPARDREREGPIIRLRSNMDTQEPLINTYISTIEEGDDPDSSYIGGVNMNMWHPAQSVYGNWQLEKNVLDAPGNATSVFYDTDRKLVVNSHGVPVRGVNPPPQAQIDFLRAHVVGSRPTPSVEEDGKIIHKDYPHLQFNLSTYQWMNLNTGTSIPGLPWPREAVL